jgi:hypothetical protein
MDEHTSETFVNDNVRFGPMGVAIAIGIQPDLLYRVEKCGVLAIPVNSAGKIIQRACAISRKLRYDPCAIL